MAARFCPYCNSTLTREDINLEQTIALCPTCNNVFQFTRERGGCTLVQPAGVPEPELPPRIGMLDSPAELVISRWLWTRRSLPLLMFTALWTLLTLAMAVFAQEALGRAWPATMAVLALVLAGLLFVSAVRIFNREVLRVSSDRIQVKPEPVPWVGKREWPASEIMQVLAEQAERRQKDGEVVTTYELRVALRDNSVHTVLVGLDTPEQALFVEQQIEARLPIARLAGRHADQVGRR